MTTLLPHQVAGMETAVRHLGEYGGAGLWWQVRSGKTRTAFATALRVGARRILIIQPKQVLETGVWESEASALLGEGVPPFLSLLAGSVADKVRRLAQFEDGVVGVTWDVFWRPPLLAALVKHGFGFAIADESHMAKAPTSKRARGLAALRPNIPYRMALSGTPLAQRPFDVWTQYQWLSPGIFPRTFTQMRIRYSRPAAFDEFRDPDVFITSGRGGALQRWKFRDLDHLGERMGLCATTFENAADVPDSEEAVACRLEPSAMRVYRAVEEELIAELANGAIVTAANAMTVNLRLQQITGGSVRDEDGGYHVVSTAKRDALAEWFESVGDEPVVVFARFKSDMIAVHEAAKAAGLDSREHSGSRREMVEWQNGAGQVLVVQVQAGGSGVSLVRARLVWWYSLSYSQVEYEQTRGRIMGPAKQSGTGFYHLTAEGTVDQVIYRALRSGADVSEAVMAGMRH